MNKHNIDKIESKRFMPPDEFREDLSPISDRPGLDFENIRAADEMGITYG